MLAQTNQIVMNLPKLIKQLEEDTQDVVYAQEIGSSASACTAREKELEQTKSDFDQFADNLIAAIKDYGDWQMTVGELSEVGSEEEYNKACSSSDEILNNITTLLGK